MAAPVTGLISSIPDKEFIQYFTKTLEGKRVSSQHVSFDGLSAGDTASSTPFLLILDRLSGGSTAHYLCFHPVGGQLLPHVQRFTWAKLKGWLEFRTIVMDGKLFVLGGRDRETGRYTGRMAMYDPHTDRWNDCTPMKKARINFTINVLDKKLFVTGGECSGEGGQVEVMDHCESYEPLVNCWNFETRLPSPRTKHSATVVNGKLYVYGGQGKTSAYNRNFWEMTRDSIMLGKKEAHQCNWNSDWEEVLERKTQGGQLLNVDNVAFSIGGIVQGPSKKGGKLADEPEDSDDNDESDDSDNEGCQATRKQPMESTDKVAKPGKGKGNNIIATSKAMLGVQVAYEKIRGRDRRKAKVIASSTHYARFGATSVSHGKRIYILGGRNLDKEGTPPGVEFYHKGSRRWYKAFNLSCKGLNFQDIECCILNIPNQNRNFKLVSSTYKFPIW